MRPANRKKAAYMSFGNAAISASTASPTVSTVHVIRRLYPLQRTR